MHTLFRSNSFKTIRYYKTEEGLTTKVNNNLEQNNIITAPLASSNCRFTV